MLWPKRRSRVTSRERIANARDSASLIAPTTRRGRSEWAAIVPDTEWTIYLKALNAVRPLRLPFMLGGAFGLACHTGRWRNTKDLDLFVMPEHHEAFVDALLKNGFNDYYETLAYDRGWIFRAIHEGVIVDVIWDTPNRRTQVDAKWFEYAPHVTLRGEELMGVPAEELLILKSFVLQKDRCDWTDLINLLCFTAGVIDWEHVIDRFGSELLLLRGLLNVFAWACPIEASQIPEPIRKRLGVEVNMPDHPILTQRERIRMLDSRPWFSAFQPMDAPMKI
jgi:hypothetical protein